MKTLEQEAISKQADENFKNWKVAYDSLKKMILEASEEQLEEYIQISLEMSSDSNETELRKFYQDIRDGKR